ncbi:MAG TPA: hypothetical protein VKY44_09235 [Flavobacterium sp.]|nr:hypothetical protein [Flavobacterium sp.]
MKSGVLVLILLFVSCKINRTKNGVPVGKWKYITQSGKNTDRVVGRYNRFGNEKGKWRYYYNDTLYRFEKYHYPYCVNVLYHSNGSIAEVGKSVSSHSSWTKYDVWYFFDEKQVLMDSVVYE